MTMFARGQLPQGPKIETKRALLLIDFQNDFVTAVGKCHVTNTQDFVPRLPNLVNAFREKGPVVWINSVYRTSAPVLSEQSGIPNIILSELQSTKPSTVQNACATRTSQGWHEVSLELRAHSDPEAFLTTKDGDAMCSCLPGSAGIGPPEALEHTIDRKKDIVSWKSQYSAFGDFKLVMQLRARIVNELVVCGSLSNIGVFATVCDAVQQGFKVTIVEDCLGYRDELCHLQAMRRMADEFGAEGIDYQELMDDIHGLLGDVIPASTFTRNFELAVTPQPPDASSRSQSTSDWVENVSQSRRHLADADHVSEQPDRSPSTAEEIRTEWIEISSDESAATEGGVKSCSSQQMKPRHSPKSSPPRKRSTSDMEECDDPPSAFEDVPTTSITRTPTLKKSRIADSVDRKQRSTDTKPVSSVSSSAEPRSLETEPTKFLGQSRSTGRIDTMNTLAKTVSNERAQSYPNINTKSPPPQHHLPPCQSVSRDTKPVRRPRRTVQTFLTEGIGDGDCRLELDILPSADADETFKRLKANVKWQKMYHRTGEVPRLVAVQGDVTNGVPIYRHPADESPSLLPFDDIVASLRQRSEEIVGHPLNHVLIQHYRSGADNISEHSDKTLDIARGSSIVNLSFGAMRTMTLRAKKVVTGSDAAKDGEQRASQRFKMPHNSLFVLGWRTNANWLHSIRADKRPRVEKCEEELAFDGQRISLTFRQIATFIDDGAIWGQGATQKQRKNAQRILKGEAAGRATEQMIVGFGKENHLTETLFDWDEIYGSGFDVVNFEVQGG